MRPIIEACPHLIEHAAAAVRTVGLTPRICSTRGGTDGARLSFKGLPCPNLGAGGYAYHGPMEHITAESIETVSRILIEIVAHPPHIIKKPPAVAESKPESPGI